VGAEPVSDYCREVEVYLCRKNDGHLIRVVGPSFEVVSGWAARGVPIKIVFEGIDRYFERYYRAGARRRPVKIDFCEADVLDVFEEWRRAVGITNPASRISAHHESQTPNPESRSESLRAHLERAVTRLSNARATGAVGAELDPVIDRLCAELDLARSKAGGLRGAAREALVERLAVIDADMLAIVRSALDAGVLDALDVEAAEELRPFRTAMAPDAYARARAAAIERLMRQRFNLPTVLFFT
jgi:hypothetical protein